MSDAKHFPLWEKMTVREIRAYIQERPSAILPIGVTEQHGYHLPTGTDMIIAQGLAERVGERLGMIVAPQVNTCFSGGQLPGTINVNPNIVGLVVGEVLRSLVAQGIRNLFLILGHGGSENLRGLDNTLKLLLRDDPAFAKVMLGSRRDWKLTHHWQEGFADGDWHAGWVETSLVMGLAPELVQMDQLATDRDDILAAMREHPDNYQFAQKPADHELVVPKMGQRPEIEVGVMGDPAKASPELGQEMVENSVKRCCEIFTELEQGRTDAYHVTDWTPEPIIL